ncbi:MAG: MFS transporter [Lachnospiraceae bacterium]|nr:MFS transporter [Lachnospiraceae bacterium]
MTEKHKNHFFYGWIIVLSCILLSASSTGLLSYFNALFVAPVTESLGVGRASFMVYSTCSTVTTMLLMPFIGGLFKKYSLKLLIIAGAVLGGCAHFCYSISNHVYGFYFGGFLAGTAICLYGSIPMTMLLANWFNDKRGFVTGIAFTGSGLVSSLFSPVIANIISRYGWRTGYRVIAISILVTTLLNVFLLIKVKPSDLGQEPLGGPPKGVSKKGEAVGFSRAQLLKMPVFWIFAFAIFAMGMVTMGTQHQLVAYWTGVGSASEAARLYSLVMFTGIFAKIFLGGIFDKFGVKPASAICCSIAALALISLIFLIDGPVMIIPALLFGMTTAVQVMSSTYLTNKFFGEKEYSSNFGLINTMLFLGVSIGVPFSGFIFDTTGTYKAAWAVYAGIMILVMFALFTADTLSQKAFKEILGVERKR